MINISVELNNVTKSYDRELILDNISAKFEFNKTHTILGPSGIGKTTLLNLIAGITTADSGYISRPRYQDVGYIFQDYGLLPWLTVIENIALPIVVRNNHTNYRALNQAVSKVLIHTNLTAKADKYPCELSGGMKQRVAIARCYASNHKLILMDEPFSSQDVKNRLNFYTNLEILKKNNNATIIMVTHDIQAAVKVSDYIHILEANSMIGINTKSPLSINSNQPITTEQLTLDIEEYLLNQA